MLDFLTSQQKLNLIAVGVVVVLGIWVAHRMTLPLVRRVISRGSRTPARDFWLRLFDPRDDSEVLGVFQKLGLRTGQATPTFLGLVYDARRPSRPIGIRFRPPLATTSAWQRDDVLAEIRAATGLRKLRVRGQSVQRTAMDQHLDPTPPLATRGLWRGWLEQHRRRTPDELVLIWC